MTDEQIIAEYLKSGDRDLFAVLVGRYEKELFAYLGRYLNDRELAMDAFQGAFLQVHLKADQFDVTRRFRPWLYRIATNQAIDLRRKGAKHDILSLDVPLGNSGDGEATGRQLLEDNQTSVQLNLEKKEQIEFLRRKLDELPENYYTVVQMVYFQGWKYRDVAEALDVPVGTVKSRMNTAISKLAEAWPQAEVA